MIKKASTIALVPALAVIVSACATYGGYEPVVDTYNDRNAASLQQDMADCKALANRAANTASDTAKGVAAGGLLGAAAGAAIGAVTGNPGKGAAIGAAAGGIGGGANQGLDADSQYKRAYTNCLIQRGHKVVN